MMGLFLRELADRLIELIKSSTIKDGQYIKSIVFLYTRKNGKKISF